MNKMKEKNTVSGFPLSRLFALVIVLGLIAVADVGYGSNRSNDSTDIAPKPPQLVDAQDAQNHLQAESLELANTTRDDKGVWFITQAGEEDIYSIFEAMGYAVATDRLWQAETYRRSARGRLAEIFGSRYLGTDILLRTIGYSDQELQDGFDALGDEEQAVISGYVAGFNRRIGEVSQNSSLLPFEFDELGFLPEDWTVLDILAWSTLIQRDFDSIGYAGMDQINNSVLYLELSEKFPADYVDMFDDLRWINDPEALTYIPAEGQATSAEEKGAAQAWTSDIPDIRSVADSMTTRYNDVVEGLKEINAHVKMGSYAWTVGGEKTASGNPIIYSGPQMGFSVPSVVLEGSIRTDSLDVSGMTVAGLPAIVIGRTPHHAWSMQVGEANTVDYYLESPDAVSLNRQETIGVAGEADFILSVYRTAHGPVINPMPFDPATYVPDPSNPIISWKYSHWGYEFDFVKSFLGLARATSMDEFGEAVESVPMSHHFCYADRDGNIAYWMSGRDPVRPAGEWRFPQGFAAPALEWDASTLIPRSTDRNNPQGFYGGWNNKTNPDYDNAPNSAWNNYGPFQRAHVIHDYLAAHDDLTFEDVRDLALNIATTSSLNGGGNPWKFVSDDFSAAVQADPTPERLAALSLLGSWDGHFVDGGESCWRSCADRSDAWTLIDTWTREAIRLTFRDELDTATMTSAHQDRTLLFNALLHGLAGEQSGVVNKYDWFQNFPDPTAPQTADAIIVKALDNVLEYLGNRPWGTNARGEIVYSHDMLGQVWTTPFAQRSTYAHCVEFAPWGPARIESMFPLGESGDILVDLGGFPVFDPNFFSMAPLFDTFTHREFQPEISLSDSLLNNACEYGTDAPGQIFEIWNSDLETLTYSITDDVDWLTCSPESGTSTGEHDTITVNFSTSGLNAGSHSATITISDPNAANSPQHISVSLDVIPAPAISIYPSSLTNSCNQGTNAIVQGFAVWNSGTGTLSYSISDNVDWLSCSPTGGTSTGETDSITVTYSTSALAAGSYSATITISDTNASNNPQIVPVELTVTAPPGLSQINLATPANESTLSSVPSFSWTSVGGTNNRFAVDLSYDWTFSLYWSTFENMRQPISGSNWTMPASLWNFIPSGSYVYWRVRGADLAVQPVNIIAGHEVWWFYKP